MKNHPDIEREGSGHGFAFGNTGSHMDMAMVCACGRRSLGGQPPGLGIDEVTLLGITRTGEGVRSTGHGRGDGGAECGARHKE